MEITIKFEKNPKKCYWEKGLGLAIILKYDPDTDIYAEHGEIWIGDYKETYEAMTDVERVLLKDSGWREDEGAWSTFL